MPDPSQKRDTGMVFEAVEFIRRVIYDIDRLTDNSKMRIWKKVQAPTRHRQHGWAP